MKVEPVEKSLLIIGGGIAGLTGACYAAKAGYKTTLLEMDSGPGGLCTSWRRKGYLFDGTMAGIVGISSDSSLHDLWKDLGVIDHCDFYVPENFGHIKLDDDRIITIHTNVDKLESQLLDLFPEDGKSIGKLVRGIRSVSGFEIPFIQEKGFRGYLVQLKTGGSVLKHLPAFIRYGGVSLEQFSHSLKNDSLKIVMKNLVHFGDPGVPLLSIMLPIAYSHRRNVGIPRKGWRNFSHTVEKRFLDLGGEIHYHTAVESLIITNDHVVGVRTRSGKEYFSPRVLSAIDGYYTHSELLKDYSGIDLKRRYAPDKISDQPVQVNLGIAGFFLDQDGPLTIFPDHGGPVAGKRQQRIIVNNRSYDPGGAPEGKSSVTTFLDSDYPWWENLGYSSKAYRREKDRCAGYVIEQLEKHFPGISAAVEVIDVSTPLTRKRYTGNHMGAMQAHKPGSGIIKSLTMSKPSYKHRKLKGFYMAGQWVERWGGVTTAALSGYKAVEVIRSEDS